MADRTEPDGTPAERPELLQWGIVLAWILLVFLCLVLAASGLVLSDASTQFFRDAVPISRSVFLDGLGPVFVLLAVLAILTGLIIYGLSNGRRWARPLPALWWMLVALLLVAGWSTTKGSEYSMSGPEPGIVITVIRAEPILIGQSFGVAIVLAVVSLWYFYRNPDAVAFFRRAPYTHGDQQ